MLFVESKKTRIRKSRIVFYIVYYILESLVFLIGILFFNWPIFPLFIGIIGQFTGESLFEALYIYRIEKQKIKNLKITTFRRFWLFLKNMKELLKTIMYLIHCFWLMIFASIMLDNAIFSQSHQQDLEKDTILDIPLNLFILFLFMVQGFVSEMLIAGEKNWNNKTYENEPNSTKFYVLFLILSGLFTLTFWLYTQNPYNNLLNLSIVAVCTVFCKFLYNILSKQEIRKSISKFLDEKIPF